MNKWQPFANTGGTDSPKSVAIIRRAIYPQGQIGGSDSPNSKKSVVIVRYFMKNRWQSFDGLGKIGGSDSPQPVAVIRQFDDSVAIIRHNRWH